MEMKHRMSMCPQTPNSSQHFMYRVGSPACQLFAFIAWFNVILSPSEASFITPPTPFILAKIAPSVCTFSMVEIYVLVMKANF
jgi:hypothetical protein